MPPDSAEDDLPFSLVLSMTNLLSAPSLARIFVTVAPTIYRVQLDWSLDSLAKVDWVIEAFRKIEGTFDKHGAHIVGAGCYVGEVLIRNFGGEWRLTLPSDGVSDVPIVVDLGDRGVLNPLGVVRKLVENRELDGFPTLQYWAASLQ